VPELPEVETTRRGLEPVMAGRRIEAMVVRDRRLRWPVEAGLETTLAGQRIRSLGRRAKYLLIELERGTLILHLGMSGTLRVVDRNDPAGRHDHLDLRLDDGRAVRFTDPRRFGSLHYTPSPDPLSHPLLAACGPEPLGPDFTAGHLRRAMARRSASIKEVLMMSHVVSGVGNIYANEALFRAGIHPRRAAGRISEARCEGLVAQVRATLEAAIAAGGSTLRDWLHADGSTGYFQQEYFVYDRAGEPCRHCGTPIRTIRQGQRATYFCPRCQR